MLTPEQHHARVLDDAAERKVTEALKAWGWAVVQYGASTLADVTSQSSRVHAVVRESSWPLRWAPDLLAACSRGLAFVEVVDCPGRPNIAVDRDKLAALDAWAAVAPVVIVEAHTALCWRHVPGAWSRLTIRTREDGLKAGRTYALVSRLGLEPLSTIFGGV